jgi:hypothetical protein
MHFLKISLFSLVALWNSGESSAQVVTFSDSTYSKDKSFFPLMKKLQEKAVKAGAQFPKPYGIAASMYFQKQQMDITKIRVGSIELDEDNGIISFEDSNIQNTVVSSQIRADVWILPFVNVYGMLGQVHTFNDIDLTINLNPLPNSPNVEDIELLRENSIAGITGRVVGLGTVVAGGYQKVFVNLNLTWAQSWLDNLNSIQKSFVAFPMIGYTGNFANFFVGGIYQNIGQVNKGSFKGTGAERIHYELEFSAEQWNYCIGFNKSIGNWSVVLMQGFGERTNSVIEVGYRFGK